MIPQLSHRVLECLYDRPDQPVWIDELAEGAERAAVEEALEAIVRRGHRLERGPGGGVRLVRPTVLDAHLIERGLPVERIGRHVICFGEVGSTNDLAFSSAAQAGGQALAVTAESQRAGRGRFGRRWKSPPGSGLLASVLLDAESARLPHEAVTVAAGLAVAEGVERASDVDTTLRWPNDVMVGPDKLAGVLVEIREPHAVIGFGINVSAVPELDPAERPAACLDQAAGRPVERIELARAVLTALDARLAELRAGQTEPLHRQWRARCGMINQRASIASGGRVFTGRVVDVSPTAGLALQTDAGATVYLPAASSTVL